MFAGNENSRAEARQFIGLLRGLAIDEDLAVMLLAHPSLTGLSSGTGTSGSTAWSNSVRARIYLDRMKTTEGDEPDAGLRTLRVKKSNYGPDDAELRLRWWEGCFVVDGSSASFDTMAGEAKAERVFCNLLADFVGQGRDVSPKPSQSYAPAVFADHPSAAGVTKKAFAAAMERLLTARRIRVDPVGPPSRRHLRLLFVAPPRDES